MKKSTLLTALFLSGIIFLYSCKKDNKSNNVVSGEYKITAIANVNSDGSIGTATPVSGCGVNNSEYFTANGVFNELTGCNDAWSGNYTQVSDTLTVWNEITKADQGVIQNFSSTGFR